MSNPKAEEKKASPKDEMMSLARELWPLNRSLTGDGVRETLRVLSKKLPGLTIQRVPSSTKIFDWTIPKEWNVKQAYIRSPDGERICDFNENNLHLMGYSTPFRGKLSLSDLQPHLHSLPNQPTAIPYVTSYYKEDWAFCISHEQREGLREGIFEVVVDTELFEGNLEYAELVIQGKSRREVMFSTYICHPSMANNELSGPVVATQLAKALSAVEHHYTYRFVFVPETIGSLCFLHKELDHLKKNLVAGFVLTCVGDDRSYSYVPSRSGNSMADKVALEVLQEAKTPFEAYSWLDRGSDERQYCAPGIDLPVCSVMRTKYGEYPEYHTSLDTLGDVVTPEGLSGAFEIYCQIIAKLESIRLPIVTTVGEPHLSKRNLYPSTSKKDGYGSGVREMMNFLSFCDGAHSLGDIAEKIGLSAEKAEEIYKTLLGLRIIEV